MKKYFIHIFVAILILSSSFQTFSVSALSNPSIIEPEPQILRDEQVRLESELTEEAKLRLQNRTEPIGERVYVAPTAEQIAQTQAQVQSIFDCNTVTDVPPMECEALVALYSSTNGASWTYNDAWLTGLEVGNWYGVKLDAGHVISIVLPFNNLTGTIPVALGTLTNLGYLDLERNQLSGRIPAELGNLNLLIHLHLNDNLLSGSIPPELDKLHILESLFLNENQLTGNIPPELGNMTSLVFLFLENNMLSGSIPAALGEMTNLQTLGLAINHLTGGIPIELDKLANLAYLSLQGNALTGSIPLSFVNLPKLIEFYFNDTHLCEPAEAEFQALMDNPLLSWSGTGFVCTSYCAGVTEIPGIECEALVALYNSTSGQDWADSGIKWFTTPTVSSWKGVTLTGSNVTGLDLSYNNLTGSIPAELGSLSNLIELNLYFNYLSGNIPPELGNLAYLQTLDLGGNQLTGSIPPELGKLRKVTTLGLGDNQLSGSLPAELGELVALQSFDLGVNELTGSIPLSFKKLTSMLTFTFPDTHLCEPADAEFQAWRSKVAGSGTGYTCISTSYCADVSMSIPQDQCEALVALYNSTSGPEWVGSGTPWFTPTNKTVSSWDGVTVTAGNVTGLNLTMKQLNGNIPPELGKLTNLQTLDLGANLLTGSIPAGLGRLSSLENLNLNSNDLSGNIPAELGSLSNLIVLKLYSNHLSGSISPAVGNLTNLQTLDLGANLLTGSIPPIVGRLSNLIVLNLYSNQLTGSIPPEVGNLTKLQSFDLSTNQLSGSIPPELGKLGKLTKLWLGVNQLSRSIPAELGNLANLQSFDLGYNPLTGSIPLSFVKLTSMSIFYFIETNLCEPADGTFQTWKQTVLLNWEGTGLPCHAPVAMADAYSTPEDSELVVTATEGVLDNDTDADGDILAAKLVSNVANGSLVLVADGSFTYEPNPDFNGEDSFKYKVFDTVEYSGDITVTIVVNQALFLLYYFPLIIK